MKTSHVTTSHGTIFGNFAVVDATSFELTYKIPPETPTLSPGSLCIVPVNNRSCVGIFVEYCQEPTFTCRNITGVVPWTKPFPQVLQKLAAWISSYYLVSKSRALRLLAPGFVWDTKKIPNRDKRLSKSFEKSNSDEFVLKEKLSTKIKGEHSHTASHHLSSLRPEQHLALEKIFTSQQLVSVLFGVTGSGKTEVYLNAAERVITSGQRVLVLVPEISLTPQMTSRFRAAFGDSLSVVHSMLTPVEHEREWFRILHGQASIVLGVRSAVFAPLQNVGLIIVDEEHDNSYKSEEMPCYNARDVAVKRASLENARCILGSATPSLESYTNVKQGRYNLAVLESRHSGHKSRVEVFDAKKYLQFTNLNQRTIQKISRSSLVKFDNNVIIDPILDLLRQNKERGEQSMVILNRRGYASFALCSSCGSSLQCPHCSVSTTLHAHCATERCHYCGFETPTRKHCSSCGGTEIVAMGAGTQNLETELQQNISGLRLTRLDRDVLTSNTRLGEILKSFRNGEVDCLVGTQLLSKGHDFPRVTLIVVVHVEDGLFLPDFRASERTFQLLTQAAGRAGRAALPGVVAVQSLAIGNPVIELALEGNVTGFLERELELRKLAWHPPFTRQILIEIKTSKMEKSLEIGNSVREKIVAHWKSVGIHPSEARIIGPQPATLEKLKNVFRSQIAITATKNNVPSKLIPESVLNNKNFSKYIRFDVDPHSFL